MLAAVFNPELRHNEIMATVGGAVHCHFSLLNGQRGVRHAHLLENNASHGATNAQEGGSSVRWPTLWRVRVIF